MYFQSSDDEQSPIFCDSCEEMIQEKDYIKHWQHCMFDRQKKSKQMAEIHAQKKQRNADNEQKIICNNCNQELTLDQLDDHINLCSQLLIQCKYCQAKLLNNQIDNHQKACEQKYNKDNQKNDEKSNKRQSIAGIIRQYSAQLSQKRQFLNEIVYPAINRIGRGIKKSDLSKIPAEKYDSKKYREDYICSICQQNFKQGQSVIKIVCSHIHHQSCYKELLQNDSKCPVCKIDIRSKLKQSK